MATNWKSSSRCDSSACVEVRDAGDTIEVRDSKDPHGSVLRFTRVEWDAFLGGVHTGDFDHITEDIHGV